MVRSQPHCVYRGECMRIKTRPITRLPARLTGPASHRARPARLSSTVYPIRVGILYAIGHAVHRRAGSYRLHRTLHSCTGRLQLYEVYSSLYRRMSTNEAHLVRRAVNRPLLSPPELDVPPSCWAAGATARGGRAGGAREARVSKVSSSCCALLKSTCAFFASSIAPRSFVVA